MNITITVGDAIVFAELYDTEIGRKFAASLPQTISMFGSGGREFYGKLDGTLEFNGKDIVRTAADRDIAYWFSGNGVALFYDMSRDRDVKSGIIMLGKITSDLTVFKKLSDSEIMTFDLAAQ